MAQILHLDVDQDLEEVKATVGDLQVGDVAAVLADDRREAAEAGLDLVVAEEDLTERRRKIVRLSAKGRRVMESFSEILESI